MNHSYFQITVSGSDFKIHLWDLTLHNCRMFTPKFRHNVVCLCTTQLVPSIKYWLSLSPHVHFNLSHQSLLFCKEQEIWPSTAPSCTVYKLYHLTGADSGSLSTGAGNWTTQASGSEDTCQNMEALSEPLVWGRGISRSDNLGMTRKQVSSLSNN